MYENFFNVAHAAANVARLNFDVSSEGTYHYTVCVKTVFLIFHVFESSRVRNTYPMSNSSTRQSLKAVSWQRHVCGLTGHQLNGRASCWNYFEATTMNLKWLLNVWKPLIIYRISQSVTEIPSECLSCSYLEVVQVWTTRDTYPSIACEWKDLRRVKIAAFSLTAWCSWSRQKTLQHCRAHTHGQIAKLQKFGASVCLCVCAYPRIALVSSIMDVDHVGVI